MGGALEKKWYEIAERRKELALASWGLGFFLFSLQYQKEIQIWSIPVLAYLSIMYLLLYTKTILWLHIADASLS